jgi:hypothetical protein
MLTSLEATIKVLRLTIVHFAPLFADSESDPADAASPRNDGM